MIFHTHDYTYKTLTSCWKRAKRFAKKGNINPKHDLAAAWSNCKMMLDAEDDKPMRLCESVKSFESKQVKEFNYSLICMDWFAARVESFSKEHMLKDDKTLASILYEWQERMFFDPTKISL